MNDTEQLERIRDLLRPLLGKEPCPTCKGAAWDTSKSFAHDCPVCRGTGTRDVIDGMGTVEAVQRMAGWYAALDDALVVHWCWKPGHDTDPRKALNDLIYTQMSIALDPAVSEEAAKLRDTYLAELDAARAAVAEMRERAAKVADAEREQFMKQAGDNNGRESDFAFGSVNSGERIAAAIRALPLPIPPGDTGTLGSR